MEGEMALGQIGQRLAEARTARGLSLEQVQEITKIRLKYLTALEAENWQDLPGEVYLRGFLKSYAQVVGLDPMEMLELYQPTPPPQSEPIPVAKPAARVVARVDAPVPKSTGRLSGGYSRVDRRMSRAGSRRSLRALVTVVMLLGLVYLGYRAWQPPAVVPPPSAPTGTTGGTPAAPPGTGTPSGNEPSPTPPTVPVVQLTKQSETLFEVRYLVKSAQPLKLKVGIKEAGPGEAIGQCWIEVQSDARNLGDTMLRSGRTEEYAASDTLRLRLGNPQLAGLMVNVNGVEVPRLQTNEAVNLIFTRQNP